MGTSSSRAVTPGAFGKKRWINILDRTRVEREVLECKKKGEIPVMVTKIEFVETLRPISIIRPNRGRNLSMIFKMRRRGFRSPKYRDLMKTKKTHVVTTPAVKKPSIFKRVTRMFQRKGDS